MIDPLESSIPRGSSETSSLAMASLVTGILGVTCNALILPLVAIACGHLAKRRIRASEGRLSGDVFASWGLMLGYIGSVVSVIVVLALVFVIRYSTWYLKTIQDAAQ